MPRGEQKRPWSVPVVGSAKSPQVRKRRDGSKAQGAPKLGEGERGLGEEAEAEWGEGRAKARWRAAGVEGSMKWSGWGEERRERERDALRVRADEGSTRVERERSRQRGAVASIWAGER